MKYGVFFFDLKLNSDILGKNEWSHNEVWYFVLLSKNVLDSSIFKLQSFDWRCD